MVPELEFAIRLAAGLGAPATGITASYGASGTARPALFGADAAERNDRPAGKVAKFDPRYAPESRAPPANSWRLKDATALTSTRKRPEVRKEDFRAMPWFETGALDG